MLQLNDVLSSHKLKIYQDDNYFKFSLDGVLLANFVEFKYTTKKILDIGTGTGIIPLLLTTKTKQKVDAIEIQKELCDIFDLTVKYNHLSNQINIINSDIKAYAKQSSNLNKYDILICNPPYYGRKCNNEVKTTQRHQESLDLPELMDSSRKLLKTKGSLFLVYDSMEFSKIIKTVHEYSFSIKKIQFVHYNKSKKSSIFLLECIKQGNTQTNILPPFILYDDDNNKTKEYERIFMDIEGEKDESKEL